MIRSRAARWAAVISGLLLAAAPWSPISAAAAADQPGQRCAPDEVTVVVDYAELGDGVRGACATNAGDRASEIFVEAGFPLDYAVRSAGFVCRVTKAPADAGCVDAAPATAYWSLWWSDGTSGEWSYATRGPQALRVPAGGYVAFVWHEGSGNAQPPQVAPGDADVAGDDDGGAPDGGVADSVQSDSDDGLPLWLPLVGGVLVVGAGVVIARRRRAA